MSCIATMPFGNTGHTSTRIIFGAAAIGAMQQPKADQVLETLLEFGINHIDVAAMYGDAELRLAPILRERRDEFFLATKTRDRSRQAAAESIDASLARMEVDQIDLIQLHNLTEDDWWEEAMAPGGALEALVEARDSGKVRFLGVTGHGTRAAELHVRSLERFPFDSGSRFAKSVALRCRRSSRSRVGVGAMAMSQKSSLGTSPSKSPKPSSGPSTGRFTSRAYSSTRRVTRRFCALRSKPRLTLKPVTSMRSTARSRPTLRYSGSNPSSCPAVWIRSSRLRKFRFATPRASFKLALLCVTRTR